MKCGNEQPTHNGGSGFIVLIVLYILLAIIIGSRFC